METCAMKKTITLKGITQRSLAKNMIDAAGVDYVVEISPPKRSLAANSLLWALLTDISQQRPEGRMHSRETWKGLFMHAAGHEVQWLPGLSGQPFPAGFRSSKMDKKQMADLIDWIYAYGIEHGVKFQVPKQMEPEQ